MQPFYAGILPWPFHYVKKNANEYGKTVLKKNSAIRDGKKGLEQDADVQCSVLLYP